MSSTPRIRPYSPTDRSSIDRIFRETCDSSLKTEPLWTVTSYLWCHPYPILSPSTCFVLDDGNGTAVGYILGTPDTARFNEDWKSIYVPQLDKSLLPPPGTAEDNERAPGNDQAADLLDKMYNDSASLLNSHFPGLWRDHPGHLHIDILPRYHRQGWGKKLIDTFVQALKNEGCKGVHLGMVEGSDSASKFYQALGFTRFPVVLDGGQSGDLGRTGGDANGVVYLVKKI